MKHMAKGKFRAIGRVSLALALSLGLIMAVFMATPALASNPAPVWQSADQQTNSGTSASGSVAKPTNLAAGDLVILIVVTQNSNGNSNPGITPPANFTLIRSAHDTSSTRRPEVLAYWKIATASEPASYSFTVGHSNPQWKAIAGRVTGYDTNSPIGNSSGSTSGSSTVTSLAIAGITTSADNVLLVGAVAARGYSSSGPTNFVKPASMIGLWAMNGTGTGSSGQPGTGGGEEVFATAGATGTRTFTWTNSARAAGLMFEILPVAAVTQITGQTHEVNCATLAGVNVTLYQGAVAIANTVSDGTGNYTLAVPALGDYNVTASKAGFNSETQAISVTEAITYTLDFVGDHGLVPNAPDLSYVLACINLWQFGTPPCQLGLSKMLAVINAWEFPSD